MDPPNQRRHVAIVCDTVPYPTRSGDNQRIAELIRILRQEGWFVHFVLTGFSDKRMRQVCRVNVDALHIYPGKAWRTLTRNWLRRCVRLVDRLMKKLGLPPAEETTSRILGRSITPIVLDYWMRYPQGLDDFVAELAAQYPWNAVIVEYIWLYPAAQKLRNGVARLLDTQDIQHRRVEEFASRGMTFPLRITRDEEARIFGEFDAVIAIQSEEAALIREMAPKTNVLTAGSSGLGRNPIADRPLEGRVLYVGGFNGANVDGLERFLRVVWPCVRQKSSLAHLHVCGYVYRAFLGRDFDRVKFLGHVEDIEAEYESAWLVINPVWIGTGLKIKSVEAIARGKPLVTTSKGIEGLHPEVKEACLADDDDCELSERILTLLTTPQARAKLAHASTVFAKNHLTPQSVYKELLAFLEHRA